jgi:hypothetical protein
MANTVTTYENQGFTDVNSLLYDVVLTLTGQNTGLNPTDGVPLTTGQMYFAPVKAGNYSTVFPSWPPTAPFTPPTSTTSTVLVLEATQLVDPFAALDPTGQFIQTGATGVAANSSEAASTTFTPAAPPIDTSTSTYPNNPTKDPWRITFQTYDWKNYSSFKAVAPPAASGTAAPYVTGVTGGTWTPDGDAPMSMAIYLGTPSTMSTDITNSLTLGWHQRWPNTYPIWANSLLNGGCTYYDWVGPVNIAIPDGNDVSVQADQDRVHYYMCTYGQSANSLREIGGFLKSYTLLKAYDFVEPLGNTGSEWSHPFDPVYGASTAVRFGPTSAAGYQWLQTNYPLWFTATGTTPTVPGGNVDLGPNNSYSKGGSYVPGFKFNGASGAQRMAFANDNNAWGGTGTTFVNTNIYKTTERETSVPGTPVIADYYPASDGDGPDVNDPAQLFINRYMIRTAQAASGTKGMFATMSGRAAAANPLSYRLVLSDHGMFFAVWGENPEETAANYSWMLIQRPVSKNSGVTRGVFSDFYHGSVIDTNATSPTFGKSILAAYTPDVTRNGTLINSTAFDIAGMPVNFGNRPLFCINSTGNKFYKFVVREHDLPIPSGRKDAANNSEDSSAVLNSFRQQSLTENGEYVITFINNLNSSRFKYSDELDMVGTVSADIVGGGTDIQVSVYNEKIQDPTSADFGQPSKRTYHALWPSGQYGTKMRIVVVKRVPDPNMPVAYQQV